MVDQSSISTYHRILNNLQERAERVNSGKINCIPFPFKRFCKEIPGIEQSMYYLLSASSKIGKSKLTDFLFLYNAVEYAYNNPDKLRIKIWYFSLEMNPDEKYRQFISHMLFKKSNGKIKLSPKDLKSTDSNSPLKPEILSLLRQPEYEDYFNFFINNVVYISDIRNPTGITKFCRDYASNNGTTHYKKQLVTDKDTKEVKEIDIMDYYIQDDPDEYRIVILDHISLISPEAGKTLHESIVKLSSDYFVKLRNNFHYTIVVIQQQAAESESLDSFKHNKLKPSLANLGDCKLTARDCSVAIGLYSPYRYGIASYEGYDITKFRDKIRFIEVLANREGEGNLITPLLFEGAVDYFKELPLPSDAIGMNAVYRYLDGGTINTSSAFMVNKINLKNKIYNEQNIGTCKEWFWQKYKSWRDSRIKY